MKLDVKKWKFIHKVHAHVGGQGDKKLAKAHCRQRGFNVDEDPAAQRSSQGQPKQKGGEHGGVRISGGSQNKDQYTAPNHLVKHGGKTGQGVKENKNETLIGGESEAFRGGRGSL